MKNRASESNQIRRWSRRLSTLTAACATALLLTAAVNQAQAKTGISVNYCSTQNNNPGWGPTYTAGVVPLANWNNVPWTGTAGSLSNPPQNAANSWKDSYGVTVSGLSVTLPGDGYASWNTGPNGSASGGLFSEWVYTANPITITGIPYAQYDLYLYLATWDGAATYTIGGTTVNLTDGITPQNFGSQGFVEGNNYGKFTGLTAASLSIANTKGVSAFQIVQVLPVATVSGTVTDTDVPVEGVVVRATQTAHPDQYVDSLATDVDGNYSLQCEVGQEYQLSIASGLPAGRMLSPVPDPFTPDDDTPLTQNLTLGADPEYDSAALVSIKADSLVLGENLPIWMNKGTLGGSFNKVTGGTGPTVTTIGGKKAVEFSSVAGRRDLTSTFVSPASIQGNNPWTMHAVVYRSVTQAGNENVFFTFSNVGDGLRAAAFRYSNDGWAFTHWGWEPWWITRPVAGTWHSMAVTYDGTTARLYRDGVQDREDTHSALNLRGDTMRVGCAGNTYDANGWAPFNGAIASLKVYSRALDATEVLALEPPKYIVAASVDPAATGGTIMPSGDVSIAEGLTPTFTIKPAFAKQILDVKVDDVSVLGDLVPVDGGSTYTFPAVLAPHTIVASFEDAPATANRYEAELATLNRINVVDDANASNGKRTEQNGWGGDNVPSMTFTVNVTAQGMYEMAMGYRQPWDGNRDTYLSVNGVPLGTIPAPWVADPSYGRTLKDIALMAGDNTIVLYNNVSWGPHWDYIELPFDAKGVAWFINASVDGDGGTVSPAGNVGVADGTGQTFTITPNYGYVIADVLVDDVSVGAVPSHTITPTAAATIVASFALIPPSAPSITNEAPQGVAVSYALACGYLVATNYAPTTVKLFYGPTDGGMDPNNWGTAVDLGVRSQGEIMQLITGITGPVYYRFYATNIAGQTWCDVPTLITPAAPFNTAGYVNRLTLTCSGYSGTETLINFPVLVKLNTGINGFSYGDFRSGNSDIRFITADGSELKYEIDTWNTGGDSLIWVQVPALQASAQIVMCYNKAGDAAPAYTTDGSTWDGTFAGVWHMTTKLSKNATGNTAFDITTGWDLGNISDAPGKIGGGQSFLQPNGLNAGDVDLPYGGFTVSFWANVGNRDADGKGGDQWNVIKGGSYGLWCQYNNWHSFINNDWWPVTPGNNGYSADFETWVYVLTTFDGVNMRMYKNGEFVNSNVPNNWESSFYNNNQLQIGNSFYGKLDEVRAVKVRRSADWIKAEYDNQSSSGSFITYGKVQTAGGTILLLR